MKINENTVICGDKVILVPYRSEHVLTYHAWMQSPELLELTASEPLTLEEEYEMQRKWHLDEDKLTFILLSPPLATSHSANNTASAESSSALLTPAELKECSMIGDVNMFLPDGLEGDAECEIMIASSDHRRKGYAREALQLFLSYAITTLSLRPQQLIARIGMENQASIRLFESLGFGIAKRIEVFSEVELRWGHATEGAPAGTVDDTKAGDDGQPEWMTDLQGRKGAYDAA